MVENKLGGKVWDNIHNIYKEGTHYIASFAPVVFEACKWGDEVAMDIVDRCAQYIAELVKFASSNYDCGNSVVMAGSLVSKSDVLINALKRKLGENVNIIVPTLPQIYGACVKCCKMFGEMKENFFENFCSSYNK